MANLPERRKYKRCDTLVSKALVSTNKKKWESIELRDLSAGGLLFSSQRTFNENNMLYFDLSVYNMLSEFNGIFEGSIVRVDRDNENFIYAILFENIDEFKQVQLDELVKSKITIRNTDVNIDDYEQGYSMSLLPQLRPGKHKPGIGNHRKF